MLTFSISVTEIAASLWRNRSLVRALIQREVVGRYRGSFMGILWSFFNPLLMLVIYTFVFSVVFKSRWGTGSESKTEFALILFAGLILFNLFSECVNRAPVLIVANANYVKKVVFPLEILPWVSLGSALFHFGVSLTVWLSAYLILFGVPHPTVFLLPAILMPLVLFTIGLTWFLAALGVYLRDVAQMTGILTSILMFLSPIFYPVSALPEKFRALLLLNPLTLVIEQVRDVMFWGVVPNLGLYLAYLAGAFFMAWIGFAFFQKSRKGFADVL